MSHSCENTSKTPYEINIDRYNKYKERLYSAKVPIIRAFLHLVRPDEGFPRYSVQQIHNAWDDWRIEEKAFHAAVGGEYLTPSTAPTRIWPNPPAEDAPFACWRMWGISIQFQVEGDHTTSYNLNNVVNEVLATEECASHPSTCPCRVSNNPWTYMHHVRVLEPLGIKHNPMCQCAGYRSCKEKGDVPVKSASKNLSRANNIPYVHCNDTCPCGECHSMRVSSGKQEEYMEKVRKEVDLMIKKYYT